MQKIAVVAAVFLLAFLGFQATSRCATEIVTPIAKGESLDGIIEDGEQVNLELGYYACHEVRRGDIVAVRHPSKQNPLLKVVKGIPGDRVALVSDGGVHRIAVNGAVLTTNRGEPYVLNEERTKTFPLYFRGILPENQFLVLGNVPSGSFDGTAFGPILYSAILGKVTSIP